ncbi:MAG: RdgB/HAM1 family non-canonical purine NTP pyrophosphatase [Ignavibacteriae bacterium]|nr:RdgB/HAM1 family non-canonical purine NTP pyrophosphatase [Ignavibacteriota bacterium]
MKQMVLATHNHHKAEEFRSLLRDLNVEILTLDQFPNVGEIDEDGATIEENALKKAREVFRHTRLPSLADDTGLEVHYLNMVPGVYSSRYAGPNATYADNRKQLLTELTGVPPRRRTARFRCVLAFVAPEDVEETVEGTCSGVITENPRGQHGFGYDPIFLPIGYDKTFGEMDAETKNTISHRAVAAQNIKGVLNEYFG